MELNEAKEYLKSQGYLCESESNYEIDMETAKRKFEQLKVSYEGMANMAGIIANLAEEIGVESFLDFKEDFDGAFYLTLTVKDNTMKIYGNGLVYMNDAEPISMSAHDIAKKIKFIEEIV